MLYGAPLDFGWACVRDVGVRGRFTFGNFTAWRRGAGRNLSRERFLE
jgi:hypothetical protein